MPKSNTQVEVSTKNTKEQILSAYHNVLEQLNSRQQEMPAIQKAKAEQSIAVAAANNNSRDQIIDDLSKLKIQIIKQMDGLSEGLLNEFNKFETLRNAILIEQKHLDELYQIKENANSLAALIQAHSNEKEQFSKYMEEQKVILEGEISAKSGAWKNKLAELEVNYKDRQEQLERNRKREEEEYQYNLELTRRQENDVYNAKKVTLDKALAECEADIKRREASIAAQENEFEELQNKVLAFPKALEIAIQEAENKVESTLKQQHSYALELKERDNQAEVKLLNQKVQYLESKIAEQDVLIKELNHKASTANDQVQAIACRALETSSQRYNFDRKTPHDDL